VGEGWGEGDREAGCVSRVTTQTQRFQNRHLRRTVGTIAERLGLESSTITPLVKRLESAGLVTRARNPEDERQVQVRLTPRGREIRDECGCLGEELLARSGMTGEQLGKLNRKVQALRDAVAR